MWYPTLFIGASDVATAFLTRRGYPVQRAYGAQAGASFLFGKRHSLSLSYNVERRTASARDAQLLALGQFGALQLGYNYTFVYAYPYSVGAEHGQSLSAAATWYNKSFGAAFEQWLINLDARFYINNPLFDNHVLALRFASALSLGPENVERFYLGGSAGASFLTSQTARQYPLRGLVGFLPGTGLIAAYAEYRMPLWQVARGLWTTPIYLQKIHAAIFCDAGNTFGRSRPGQFSSMSADALHSVQHLWSTAGAELRADLAVGWAWGLTVRLGIAVPTLVEGQKVQGQAISYVDFGTFI